MEAENAGDKNQTVNVSEDKFNGSATLDLTVPDGMDKRTVKAYARKFFKDTHGTDPSRVVAEKDETGSAFRDQDEWTVMVSDHSSGSLVDSTKYEVDN
jgi:HKD family nuclease